MTTHRPRFLCATRHVFFAAAALLANICPAQTAAASTETPATPPGSLAAAAEDFRPEIKQLLPQHALLGKGRLRVWGFEVYDARLWAMPTFSADKLSQQTFALELAYLRDFTNTNVAKRSIEEMRRNAPISDAQASAWVQDLLRVLPNIKKGDRITGVHRPGVGAAFLVNGKASGEIRDVEFARLFFGIWLSGNTSEPKLRSALLAGLG